MRTTVVVLSLLLYCSVSAINNDEREGTSSNIFNEILEVFADEIVRRVLEKLDEVSPPYEGEDPPAIVKKPLSDTCNNGGSFWGVFFVLLAGIFIGAATIIIVAEKDLGKLSWILAQYRYMIRSEPTNSHI